MCFDRVPIQFIFPYVDADVTQLMLADLKNIAQSMKDNRLTLGQYLLGIVTFPVKNIVWVHI